MFQVFFPYLNATGFRQDDSDDDDDELDRFSQTKDGVAKKKLKKNEYLDNYVESFQKKVSTSTFEFPFFIRAWQYRGHIFKYRLQGPKSFQLIVSNKLKAFFLKKIDF